MDATIIRNWNERVKDEDTVFLLGDFCFKGTKKGVIVGEGGVNSFKYYEEQLNGKIIYLKGNHDNNNKTNAIIENITIKHGGRQINLVHRPIHAKQGMLNLVGHVHQNWLFRYYETTVTAKGNISVLVEDKKTPLINVGVDRHNFYPVNIQEILSILAKEEKNYGCNIPKL